MDNVQALEIAYDLAQEIIENPNVLISNNDNEIREVLDNDQIMDAILINLEDYYENENVIDRNVQVAEPGMAASTALRRFIEYNRNYLNNIQSVGRIQNNNNNIENNINNIINDNSNSIVPNISPVTPTPSRMPSGTPPISPTVRPLNISSITDAAISALPDEVQAVITCPLTQTIMSDPVIDTQGNTYERSAIETWIATRSPPTDPINRQPITNMLIPNMAIRSLIQQYFPMAGGKKQLTRRRKIKKNKKTRK